MAAEKKVLPFPKEGVRFQAFYKFIEECGGRENIKGLTTTDVCQKYLMPMTVDNKESYIDYLRRHERVSEFGIASVFISHAWKFVFLDVLDALENHFNKDPDIVLWFDLFGNNQHSAPDLDFTWWSTTFKSAIAQFGHTVLILAPWSDPVPLTRAWCLFEIYCSNETKSKFEVAMSTSEKTSFLQTICSDFGAINDMIARVDAQNSVSWNPADREKIFNVVRSTVGFDAVNSMVFEQLRQWVISVTQYAYDYETDKKVKNDLNIALAQLYRSQGKLKESEVAYEESLNYCELVEDGINFLRVHKLYADLKFDQGKYDEAEKMYLSCYKRAKESYGENNVQIITFASALASLYHELGRYEEAIDTQSECIRIAESHPNLPRETVASLTSQLGTTYFAQGKNELAEPLYLAAYDILKEKHGPDHEEVLSVMNDMAILYEAMGKYHEAEDMYLKSLQTRRVKLGDENLHAFSAMQNLCALYALLRRDNDAIVLLEEFLPIQKRILGDDNNSTLITMTSLAACYASLTQYDKSLEFYLEALDKKKQIFGENHPEVLMIMSNLGLLYRSMEKNEESENILVEVIDRRKKVLGVDHPGTLTSMNNLVYVYTGEKKYEQALKLGQELYELRKKILGINHPQTLLTYSLIADIYVHLNNLSVALPIYLECEKEYKLIYEPDKYALVSLRESIAHLYGKLGNIKEGEKIYMDIISFYENSNSYGVDHTQTIYMKLALSSFYYSYDPHNKESMERWILEALESRRRLYGDYHPDTYNAIVRIVDLYYVQLGWYEKSEPYLVIKYDIELQVFGDSNPTFLDTLDMLVGLSTYKESVELVQSSPSFHQNPLHKQHPLVKLEKIYNGRYYCDLCKKAGSGWVFSCTECGFDTHPKCCFQDVPDIMRSFSDESLVSSLHEHKLSRYANIDKGIYTCSICVSEGSGYVYSCLDCDFFSHPKCCIPEVVSSITEKVAESKNEDIIEELVEDIKGVSVTDDYRGSMVTSRESIVANKRSSVSYELSDLRSRRMSDNAAGIDLTKKETYLDENTFQQVFRMTKEMFSALPKWKRDMKKKEAGLF